MQQCVCSVVCDGRGDWNWKCPSAGDWHIHTMQSCAEGGKSGFPDMKKKNVPDTVSLKKGGENGSRTKHVQCEPFFMNRIYQRIRGWKESDLTETGEIVRDF